MKTSETIGGVCHGVVTRLQVTSCRFHIVDQALSLTECWCLRNACLHWEIYVRATTEQVVLVLFGRFCIAMQIKLQINPTTLSAVVRWRAIWNYACKTTSREICWNAGVKLIPTTVLFCSLQIGSFPAKAIPNQLKRRHANVVMSNATE